MEKINLAIALVHSGSYNKIPKKGLLINSKYVFLIVLESGKSKIMYVVKTSFFIHRRLLSVTSLGRRTLGSSVGSLF